jgi:hypothetical protein
LEGLICISDISGNPEHIYAKKIGVSQGFRDYTGLSYGQFLTQTL